MEGPTDEQIVGAWMESQRRGETAEEFEARLDGLCRMADEDLAAMGIVPYEPPPAEAAVPPPADFDPLPVKRRADGWTAERQREFIDALAETGCVSEACAEVGLTARSAYKLRQHAKGEAFRLAWDYAQSLASARLTALAFERAIHGTPERLYKNGELIAERRKPSDKLLMWLLAHHHPSAYGWASKPPGAAPDFRFFRSENARAELPGEVAKLENVDRSECPAERLELGDFDPYEEPAPRA